jgi:alpha-N-arabinofuranosidase
MKTPSLALLAILLTLPLRAAQPLKLDLGKTGEPISKYVYGQFAEHLGRSIYGGLWAEMLQDRKFYYPITDDFAPMGVATDPNWGSGPYPYLNASPWKVIGAGTVAMSKDHAFAGQHSLTIVARDAGETGIAQPGLAVRAGKRYVGYVVIAGDAGPVEGRLVTGDAVQRVQITKLDPEFRSYPIEFTPTTSSDDARFEIVALGAHGTLRIGCASLMPADNLNGWRADTVSLLKQLDSPVYRWPGGNFVSGYDWKDGIGPRDKRPRARTPPGKASRPTTLASTSF